MIEILVGLCLVVIAGAGASLYYDKNKDKVNATLQKFITSFKESRQSTAQGGVNPPPKTNPPGPKLGRSRSAVKDLYEDEYEAFKASMKGSEKVSVEELRRRLKQPANMNAVQAAMAIKNATNALKKGELSLQQANQRIKDALTKLKK